MLISRQEAYLLKEEEVAKLNSSIENAESLISPFWSLNPKDFPEPQDKYFQEFKLLTKQKRFAKRVDMLRENKKIDIAWFNNRLRKFGHEKSNSKRHALWQQLEEYAKGRLNQTDIHFIRLGFTLSPSWDESLSCYIFTGKIITPSVRCKLTPIMHYRVVKKLILEIYGETTWDDLERLRPQILKWQKKMPGYQLKSKRIKPGLNDKLQVSKDIEQYKKTKKRLIRAHDDPRPISNKAIKRLKLVDKHNPQADSKEAQKREEERQRKINQRYKEYV